MEKKNNKITFRLSDKELKELKLDSKDKGLSISKNIRKKLGWEY